MVKGRNGRTIFAQDLGKLRGADWKRQRKFVSTKRQEGKQTRFGFALKALMAEKGIIPAHLSEKIGVSHTILYRLLGGSQQWTNPEYVARFAVNVSSDPHDQARLLAAKLEDEINIPGLENAQKLIQISVLDKPPAKKETLDPVPKHLEAAINKIVQACKDDIAVEAVVLNLATVLDRR